MKRTRETINYNHPEERWNISGCMTFDGEDRGEAERKAANAKIQREWLQQQMEEKKQKQAREKEMDK